MSEDEQEKTGKNVTQLVERLRKDDAFKIINTMNSLREIGEPAVDPLMELLREGDHNVRWRSAMALARIGEHSVDPLIRAATENDESVRNPSIWALAEIGAQKAVNPLITIMEQEPSECCRVLTAAALLKIGDPEGINAVHQEYGRSGEEFRGMVDEAFSGS